MWFLLCFALLASTAVSVADEHTAQKFPVRPVTMIVPQAAGGSSDGAARVIAQAMSVRLGQPVVIENRAGAGGNLGTMAAARAVGDGYTVLFNINSAHVINPSLYRKAGFDPLKDFVEIASVAIGGTALVANPSFPPNNTDELIAYAKTRPNEVMYASAGNGTINHLLGEMFKIAAGVELLHVPYKSAAGAATDVLGGRVPISFQSLTTALPFINDGSLKLIGVATKTKAAQLPNAPLIADRVPGFGAGAWFGVFAPVATPPAIVKVLRDAVESAREEPDIQQKLFAIGMEPMILSPDQFRKHIEQDIKEWSKIIKSAKVKLD